MRYFTLVLIALIGLSLGCSEQKPPPPEVDTDIPDLDINEGDLVPPGEISEPKADSGEKPSGDQPSGESSTGGADAGGSEDAGTSTAGDTK